MTGEAADDRRRVTVVAFDLMDTLVRDPFREALHAATGREVRELFALRDANAYPALERGEIDEASYWASYGAVDIAVDPERFHEVRRASTTWLPGMRRLVADVRDAGCRTVVASNYPHWLAEHADGLLAGLMDDVVGSYQLGARKPGPAFYQRLLARLGARADEVAFVDDRQANLDGAAEVGLVPVPAGSADEVRAHLAELGVAED